MSKSRFVRANFTTQLMEKTVYISIKHELSLITGLKLPDGSGTGRVMRVDDEVICITQLSEEFLEANWSTIYASMDEDIMREFAKYAWDHSWEVLAEYCTEHLIKHNEVFSISTKKSMGCVSNRLKYMRDFVYNSYCTEEQKRLVKTLLYLVIRAALVTTAVPIIIG